MKNEQKPLQDSHNFNLRFPENSLGSSREAERRLGHLTELERTFLAASKVALCQLKHGGDKTQLAAACEGLARAIERAESDPWG